jgi:hypothetical protein
MTVSITQSFVVLSVCYAKCFIQALYAEYHYAGCHYVECPFAECHYTYCHYTECYNAECRGAKSWDLSYKTFYGRNCCCILLSYSVCHCHSLTIQTRLEVTGSIKRSSLLQSL